MRSNSILKNAALYSSLIILSIVIYAFIEKSKIPLLLSVYVLILEFIISLRILGYRGLSLDPLKDGRFYFVALIFLYSVWVPIIALLTHFSGTGFSALNTYGAIKYTIEDVLRCNIGSCFLFLGIICGLYLKKFAFDWQLTVGGERLTSVQMATKRKVKGWFIISAISTLFFLMPFLKGGFQIIQNGGTILDVESSASLYSGNPIMTILGFFFSPEVMAISTIALIYYLSNCKDIPIKRKYYFIFLIFVFHSLVAIYTTRSARFVLILLATIAIIVSNEEMRRNIRFKRFIIIIAILLLGTFLIDYLITEKHVTGKFGSELWLIEVLRNFDGIGPYDAYLKAINEMADYHMFSNVVYSFFSPIPALGKYVINLLGFTGNGSPLYLWMFDHYHNIYSIGGGLAYLPQIEAYISAGQLGMVLYGFVYGTIFGRRKSGLLNYIVIAFSLMLARGSLGVIASLFWPYIFICYFLYDNVLLRESSLETRE